MELTKNTQLLHHLCYVSIRSVDDTLFLPDLLPVYHTPSSIRFTNASQNTDAGTLYDRRLFLDYPGLKETDFEVFDSLLYGAFQILGKFDNDDIYEIASINFPMTLSSDYSNGSGHALQFVADIPTPIKFIRNDNTPGIQHRGLNNQLDFQILH